MLPAKRPQQRSSVRRSFQAGGFFRGTVLTNSDKSLYDALFKRKGLFDNFFGLAEVPKEVHQKSKAPGIGGTAVRIIRQHKGSPS
jgi:hypothetical protein